VDRRGHRGQRAPGRTGPAARRRPPTPTSASSNGPPS
jgi:hypothetical protein